MSRTRGHVVRPEIREFTDSAEHTRGNPWAYKPDRPDDFHIELILSIGPAGSNETEYFAVGVVTPKHLSGRVASDGPQFGGHYLVVDKWDVHAVVDLLRRKVESLEAESWGEVREKLRRVLYYGE